MSFLPVAEVKELEEKIEGIEIENEVSISNYYKLRQQLSKLEKDMQQFITKPIFCVPFLQPGRVVRVVNDEQDEDFGWGCVINYQKKTNQKVLCGYEIRLLQCCIVVWYCTIMLIELIGVKCIHHRLATSVARAFCIAL